MKKVLIIDTSIMCVWLQVPGMETCDPDDNRWTYERISEKIKNEQNDGVTFILPMATIIETGNHIAHANGNRYEAAVRLTDIIKGSANEESPWAAFTEQNDLWDKDGLVSLAERWKDTAAGGQSLGDASIVDVANYYAAMSFEVEILTGDEGLKAYEPIRHEEKLTPRRKK